MQTLTLKPSILVAASISRVGGVTYSREPGKEEIVGEHEHKEWTTIRDVPNRTLLLKADTIASQCRRLLGQVCYRTSFGLICPKDQEAALKDAVTKIRALIDQANGELTEIRLAGSFVRGEIVTDDAELAEAISRDLRQFFQELQAALEACDVRKIRQTVAAIRGVDQLLEPKQSAALQAAVKASRKIASTIVQEVEKKGRQIAEVSQELDLSEVDVAAVMFIETTAPREPSPVSVEHAAEEVAALEVS